MPFLQPPVAFLIPVLRGMGSLSLGCGLLLALTISIMGLDAARRAARRGSPRPLEQLKMIVVTGMTGSAFITYSNFGCRDSRD
jgi:hypothetical protein